MARLPRPHVPLEIRCRVAMRQLGEMWPDAALEANKGALGAFLAVLLKRLAELLGEEHLQLDHDPALENREKLVEHVQTGRRVRTIVVPKRAKVVRYFPDANDHAALIYRGRQAHQIKTNVRGDGAQHSDRALIKREKRRLRASQAAKSSGFQKEPSGVKRHFRKRLDKSKPKMKSRPLRSGNRWPPKARGRS